MSTRFEFHFKNRASITVVVDLEEDFDAVIDRLTGGAEEYGFFCTGEIGGKNTYFRQEELLMFTVEENVDVSDIDP